MVNSSIVVRQSPQADVVATKRTTRRQRERSATGSQGTSYVLYYEVRKSDECLASLTAADQSALLLKMSQQITNIQIQQNALATAIGAVCVSLGIKGPSTDNLSPTLTPSSANSPLDSPVVALRGLSLGRTSGASQTSRRSSAHSSVKSGKSGKIYRSFRYTGLTLLHSGSQKSSEQHSERHRTGQRANGWNFVKGEGACRRRVTGPYRISVNVAEM